MYPLVALLTGLPGWLEVIVILFVGLLLFGGRLPAIARSIGQSLVEFKRGLHSAADSSHQHQLPSGSSESAESDNTRSKHQ